MVGARFRILSLAALCLLAANAAQAADYTPPPQQPIYTPPPALQECCSNWYLRGFVGTGINGNYNLDVSPPIDDNGYLASNSISDSMFIGSGIGYYFNNWLRFDATAEYRAKTNITALITEQPTSPGPVAVDQYQGNLSSWVFLANTYVDLGTWNCFTPFVGAGIGGAYNTISNFTDVTPDADAYGGAGSGSSFGLGRGTSSWNLAWALYAGMSYKVSKNFSIDFTYRYLNFGTAKETVDCNCGSSSDYKFKDLYSNDFMIGLRWSCCELQAPAPPPQYVYQPPPPVYTPPSYTPPPPPLRSRG
jgi:opacity protein-like surface antigen